MSRQEAGCTQLALAPHGLLSLVDELLLNIIDHIDNQKALCLLATTCMRLQDLAEPFIWRKLVVLSGNHARNIATALDKREARIDFVKSLSVRYKDQNREGIEELNHFVGLMGKLKHLQLESPCPNNSEWAEVFFDGYSRIDFTNLLAGAVYPRLGLPLALPMLQSLTLHAHGPSDRKFLLGRAKAMFLSTTLRNITLSCLNFEADMTHQDDMVVSKHRSTPLRSLTLIECNVNVQFLDVVLSLPKALKELSIGERLHCFADCVPSLDRKTRTSAPLFLTALERQADSLQRLAHIGGTVQHLTARETDPRGAAKLRSLTSLAHLELGFESHLYYYLRQNGFPPALKTLKMLDSAISLNAGQDVRTMSSIAFRSITTLVTDHLSPAAIQPGFTIHLHFSDYSNLRLSVIAHPAEQNRLLSTLFLDRPAIYKIATMLKSYRGHFHVSRDIFPSGTAYIPPYMYGEELPVENLMYDSDDYWRFNGINYQVVDDEASRNELQGGKKLTACIECTARDISATVCRSLANETPCWPCAISHMQCHWEDETDNAEEKEEEAGEGEDSDEYEDYVT